eukprot:scaffold5516_cov105-Cylindrotheca_fusiformis.AAC.2
MSDTPQSILRRHITPTSSVDAVLAVELGKLSRKEREKVYEDVHGVSDVIQETPEFIADCLEQMDREIDIFKNMDAYEQAKLQSSNLMMNREYRLAFLRSTLFNAKKAALHLLQYLCYKQEILGTEQPSKYRISFEDLGPTSTRILKLGSIQVLPNRDSKGRAIVVFSPSLLEPVMEYDDPIPTTVKAIWYSMSTLSEDEETQKMGIVGVLNMLGLSERHEKHHRELLWRLTAIGQVLPSRLECLHCCGITSNRLTSALLLIIATGANPTLRVRMRIHYGTYSSPYRSSVFPSLKESFLGSHTEWLYKLMSFGIPVDKFPFKADGGVQLANQVAWMRKRRKKEAYLLKYPRIEGAVDLPSNNDVLWGRGKQIYWHPGNRVLRELVETYEDEYNGLSRDDKTKLTHRIVSVVHGFSGRFLKPDKESGMWMEVSDSEAREKVAHRFRRNRELALKSARATDRDRKRPRMMFDGS